MKSTKLLALAPLALTIPIAAADEGPFL